MILRIFAKRQRHTLAKKKNTDKGFDSFEEFEDILMNNPEAHKFMLTIVTPAIFIVLRGARGRL